MSNAFTESEERQELRKQVARLAAKYGREWFTEKARAGEKTTELWLEIGKNGYLGINIPEEYGGGGGGIGDVAACLLYTSPSPRDISGSRMPSSA